MDTSRNSLLALLMFSLALLSVLAANFPPGNQAPMICFIFAGMFGAAGLGFRFRGIRDIYRAQKKARDER